MWPIQYVSLSNFINLHTIFSLTNVLLISFSKFYPLIENSEDPVQTASDEAS